MRGLAAALAAGALLAGCTVGPAYRSPTAKMPEQWQDSGGVSARPAADYQWWKTFNDPLLDWLIAQAASANDDIRIAQARVLEARAQQRAAAADLWPTLDGSAAVSRSRISQNQPLFGSLPLPAGFPFVNDDYKAGFDASWELDIFGGRRQALKAAAADTAASREALNDLTISLLAEVASNYMELRGSQRRLAIAREDLAVQRQLVDLTKARYRSGVTSELDVTEAEALRANIESEIPALQVQVAQATRRLGVLLGQQPDALAARLAMPAGGDSTYESIPAAPAEVPIGLPSDLLLRRPDIREAERRLAAETARVGVAKAEYFPHFSLNGDIGQEAISTGKWFDPGSRFWSIGPSMQWRILDFGRVRAGVMQADARAQEALAAYDRTVLNGLAEAENTLTAYANEQLRRRSIADEVEQDGRALELAQARYATGNSAFIEVLDAERSLNLARDRLAQSTDQIAVDLVALFKALGGGWETISAGA